VLGKAGGTILTGNENIVRTDGSDAALAGDRHVFVSNGATSSTAAAAAAPARHLTPPT
jgi:hypothetical protein